MNSRAIEPSGEGQDNVLSMSFVAEACVRCGHVGEPGICPECGGEIPLAAETNVAIRARRAALMPLLEEARSLLERYDTVQSGSIPVSLGQFATAITDGDLYDRIESLTDLGELLAQLDLNDGKAIGTDLRRVVSARVAALRELTELCEELAALSPEAPGEEARDLVLDAGRYATTLLLTYIELLTAAHIADARKYETRLNELLDGFPPASRMSELLAGLEELPRDDIDARVERVLSRPGSYTDELGMLEPSAVFGAFADEPQPLAQLAEHARSYFAQLLPRDLDSPELGALLTIPAVTVGVLDRPLRAHRCARLMADLCARAYANDPDAVVTIIERIAERGAHIFAASARIDRGIRLLAAGEDAGIVDDAAAIDSLLRTYTEVVEAPFRSLAWLAILLEGSLGAQPLPAQEPPMLGEVLQRLSSLNTPLARELAGSAERALRNAAAHAQYTWDPDSAELVDLDTGARWDLDAIDERMNALIGAVSGSDAGYACFLVGHGVGGQAPAWAEGYGELSAARQVAEATFGAYGFRVVRIEDEGATIIVSRDGAVEQLTLVPLLAGFASIVAGPQNFRVVREGESSPLVEISAEALSHAREAPEHVRDLAIFPALRDAVLAHGQGDAQEVTARTVPLITKVVAVTALQQLALESHSAKGFVRIADRLAYAREFSSELSVGSDPIVDEAIMRLQRTRSRAYAAQSRSTGDLKRLLVSLQALFAWAEDHGARWPPL